MEHKYIDADALMAYLEEQDKKYTGGLDVREVNLLIKHYPAADVEPVRKWIRAEERLPEELKDVLVWYEYNGLYQTCGVGYQSDGTWVGKFNGRNARVIAWMSLPEPPKMDGGNE